MTTNMFMDDLFAYGGLQWRVETFAVASVAPLREASRLAALANRPRRAQRHLRVHLHLAVEALALLHGHGHPRAIGDELDALPVEHDCFNGVDARQRY